MNVKEYLFNIEKRRTEIMPSDRLFSFKIMVDDELIGLYFQNETIAKKVSKYLVGLNVTTTKEPDEKIYYWSDNIDYYIPDEIENKPSMWNFRAKTGQICLNISDGLSSRLLASDYINNKHYVCIDGNEFLDLSILGNSSMITIASLLLPKNHYVVHSATIGCNGNGVTILGKGGKGKSTISVSCLLDNFDFVADDYTLFYKKYGELIADPIFRTVKLNQDMYHILHPNMPILDFDTTRNNKLLLDASTYSFSNHLKVKALIVPKVSEIDNPILKRINSNRAIVPMIYSTIKQLPCDKNTKLVRELYSLVNGLPTYEFALCKNIFKNREYLKLNIEKMCNDML